MVNLKEVIPTKPMKELTRSLLYLKSVGIMVNDTEKTLFTYANSLTDIILTDIRLDLTSLNGEMPDDEYRNNISSLFHNGSFSFTFLKSFIEIFSCNSLLDFLEIDFSNLTLKEETAVVKKVLSDNFEVAKNIFGVITFTPRMLKIFEMYMETFSFLIEHHIIFEGIRNRRNLYEYVKHTRE